MAYTTLLNVRDKKEYKRTSVRDLPERGDQWWRENRVFCYSREYYREMRAFRFGHYDPYQFYQSVYRVTTKDIWYEEISLQLDGGGRLIVGNWDTVFVEVKKEKDHAERSVQQRE